MSIPTAYGVAVAGSGLHQGASSLRFHGPWTTETSPTALDGEFNNLNRPGYVEITFKSTGVALMARRSTYGGIAQVYLDGVRKKSVDLYSPVAANRKVVYRVSGLANRLHTLRIVRTGTKNPRSKGGNLMVDAVNVLDRVAPAPPTGVVGGPERTGIRLTWSPVRESDVASYRIYRYETGRPRVLVSTVTAQQTGVLDVGLEHGTTYTYRLVAVDTSGNASAKSTGREVRVPDAPAPDVRRYDACPVPTATVSTRSELLSALTAARPGTVIVMAPGRYPGPIPVTVNGTADRPIWLCGPRDAVIDTGDVRRSGGIRIDGSAHLVVAGMTVRQSQKGISVIASHDVVVADTRVEDIGEEAIHLRANTTDSLVVGNSVTRTGLVTPKYGEGVYVGTAEPNWCTFGDCSPDRSDRNSVLSNDISLTTADQIEAKEGASDGLIADNTLDGTGMTSHADSLINIQSNGWVISGNSGRDAPLDGVQVWEAFDGWGQDNIAVGNTFTGQMPGYAVRLAYRELDNLVGCDNESAAASVGRSNKPCQW